MKTYCGVGRDSDVYVYRTNLNFVCCACDMHQEKNGNLHFKCKEEEEMVRHLKEHIKNGDKVPQFVINRLERASDEVWRWKMFHAKGIKKRTSCAT